MQSPADYVSWLKVLIERLCRHSPKYEELGVPILQTRSNLVISHLLSAQPSMRNHLGLATLLVLAHFDENRDLFVEGDAADAARLLLSNVAWPQIPDETIAPWEVPMSQKVTPSLLLPTAQPQLYLICSLMKDPASRAISKRFQMSKALKYISVKGDPQVSSEFDSQTVLQKLYPASLDSILPLIKSICDVYFHPYCHVRMPELCPLPPKGEEPALREMVQNVVAQFYPAADQLVVKSIAQESITTVDDVVLKNDQILVEIGDHVTSLTANVDGAFANGTVADINFLESVYFLESGESLAFAAARRSNIAVGSTVVSRARLCPGVEEWMAKQRKRIAGFGAPHRKCAAKKKRPAKRKGRKGKKAGKPKPKKRPLPETDEEEEQYEEDMDVEDSPPRLMQTRSATRVVLPMVLEPPPKKKPRTERHVQFDFNQPPENPQAPLLIVPSAVTRSRVISQPWVGEEAPPAELQKNDDVGSKEGLFNKWKNDDAMQDEQFYDKLVEDDELPPGALHLGSGMDDSFLRHTQRRMPSKTVSVPPKEKNPLSKL